MRVAAILLFALCLSVPGMPQGCDSSADPHSRTKSGDSMPPFNVTDTSGERFSLSDLKGKIVLVNFWATWCGPCRQEMPRLQREVWQKYGSAPNFALVAIAREQSKNDIEDFREQSGFTFPMAPDPKRTTYKIFADAGIPRSYVISPTGKILFQTVGYCSGDFDQMEQIIGRELAKAK